VVRRRVGQRGVRPRRRAAADVPRQRRHGAVVGVLLTERHFPVTAEIHLLLVEPGSHRRGVGRALLAAAEADLRADGVRLLEVKTLGPSYPSEPYARTRRFYAATGFLPVEELHGLWPGNPCLVLVKPLA
jgi:GNAT superfamily N-acetyltransferase